MTLYCDKDKRYLDMPCTVYFHSVFAHSDLFTLFDLERLLLLDSDGQIVQIIILIKTLAYRD